MEELKQKIIENLHFVDIKPYSHNIVAISLRLLREQYGVEEVMNLVLENQYEFSQKGWKYLVEDFKSKIFCK